MEIKSLQFYTFFPAAGQKGKGELFLCIFWGYYLYPYGYAYVQNETVGRQNIRGEIVTGPVCMSCRPKGSSNFHGFATQTASDLHLQPYDISSQKTVNHSNGKKCMRKTVVCVEVT